MCSTQVRLEVLFEGYELKIAGCFFYNVQLDQWLTFEMVSYVDDNNEQESNKEKGNCTEEFSQHKSLICQVSSSLKLLQ